MLIAAASERGLSQVLPLELAISAGNEQLAGLYRRHGATGGQAVLDAVGMASSKGNSKDGNLIHGSAIAGPLPDWPALSMWLSTELSGA